MDELGSDDAPRRGGRWLRWASGLALAGLVWVGGNAATDALASDSTPVRTTASLALLAAWGAAMFTIAVPAPTTLTIGRMIVPVTIPVFVVAALTGASAFDATASIALALVATLLLFTPELGELFVQMGAYGHERRFPLRPPPAYLIPTVVTWCALCAAALAAPLLLAARNWVLGVPVAIVAIALGRLLFPRFHRLSSRWLVLVPAGVVVHDPLVLAETAMFSRADVAGMRLAPAGTEAADITGPAAGHLVELELRDFTTITRAATKAAPRGTALHVRSMLVAPSRPGRALTAAGDRSIPVG